MALDGGEWFGSVGNLCAGKHPADWCSHTLRKATQILIFVSIWRSAIHENNAQSRLQVRVIMYTIWYVFQLRCDHDMVLLFLPQIYVVHTQAPNVTCWQTALTTRRRSPTLCNRQRRPFLGVTTRQWCSRIDVCTPTQRSQAGSYDESLVVNSRWYV